MEKTIILDIGSYETKIDFQTEETYNNQCMKPRFHFKNYMGEFTSNRLIDPLYGEKNKNRKKLFGDECAPYLQSLKLRFPIKHGIFQDEDDIISILNYSFNLLDLTEESITNHPILLSEPILNPRKQRETIASILFEKYNVPSLVFGYQTSMSLLASDNMTGLILESGEGVTQVAAYLNGECIPCSFIRNDIGGADVNEYLRKILKQRIIISENKNQHILDHSEKVQTARGINFSSEEEEMLALYEIKEKLEFDMKDGIKKISLPGKIDIKINFEKNIPFNVLFNPSIIGKNCLGLIQMFITSFERTNFQYRNELSKHFFLSGGNANIKYVREYLKSQINDILVKYKNDIKIEGKAIMYNCYSCWVGGNRIANLNTFKDILISKKDWEEKGMEIVHRQSF
jgi:centractin